MKLSYCSLAALLAHGHDEVIDVRSPAEFAEDHVSGAVNLPVLDDDERAQVGTIYKQVSPFEARKIGAALVAANAARHLRDTLRDRAGSWKPLVYCWRGGQRSGSFATILSQVGWRVGLVDGGYQQWRRLVHDAFYEAPWPVQVVLLDGLTGTAKTDLLHRVAARGGQVIDLEGLANHRGSLLGGEPGGQPSQKLFESRLAVALAALDPARPVLVEAESNKIGALHLPPSLWEAMKSAQVLRIEAPLAARADYLASAYDDLIAAPDLLRERLAPLRNLRGAAIYEGWLTRLAAGDHLGLATALMAEHYDPAYQKSRDQYARQLLAVEPTESLDLPAREALAARLVQHLAAARPNAGA